MKRSILNGLALASMSLVFFACTKNDQSSSGNGRLELYLTDAPGDFDSVVIDVQDIRINYSADSGSGWQSLAGVRTGAYNLLQLVNGRDTLLGAADIHAGRIEQIRLLLGPNNYVVVDGQRHNLETPSAQQSGLKLNIHQDVTEGITYNLLMDFDAGRSIHKTGNDRYSLKPVIRTSLQAIGGGLNGFVLPATVQTAVYAIQGADTVAGTLTAGGAWSIRGLPAGTYSLGFVPSGSGYNMQTRSGMTVTTNNVTTVDTVRLQ